MINRVVLVGRMTRDPELRRTGSGKAGTSFSLALDRGFTTQDGQSADFIPVVVWNKAAESVAQYCQKGSLVGVDGSLRSRSYDNNQGQRVFVVEVLADRVRFLESKNARLGSAPSQPQMQPGQQDNFYDMKSVDLENDFDESVNTFDIMEDDLQF